MAEIKPTPEEIEILVEFARERNLDRVNASSMPVNTRQTVYAKYVKRVLDIGISAAAIVVTLPVNAILGIITFVDLGRPIFFLQHRPGRNGKPFTLVKFRNMTNEKDEKGNYLPVDQRVTKTGAFMRKTSLDELLNFVSVLKGDMSIIGPRPLLMRYLDRYSNRHMARHTVRPGLECPNIRDGQEGKGWQAQFENDIWYVENVSFTTDCKMMIHLVRMVFDKNTRSKHAQTGVGEFVGYNDDMEAFGQYATPELFLEKAREILKLYNEQGITIAARSLE